jgi:hypothetical protein
LICLRHTTSICSMSTYCAIMRTYRQHKASQQADWAIHSTRVGYNGKSNNWTPLNRSFKQSTSYTQSAIAQSVWWSGHGMKSRGIVTFPTAWTRDSCPKCPSGCVAN